jgi:hypothetical protein
VNWSKLAQLDRRIIFGVIFLAVAVPLVLPLGLVGEVSPGTEKFYELIEQLPEGSTILVSFDCEASSWPEIGPVAEALVRHALRKRLKIVGTSFLSEGTALGYELLARLEGKAGLTYGTDWIYLGFRPQYVAAMLGMGESVAGEFPQDYLGRPVTELPLAGAVRNYGDIALVISIADDTMPQYWIEYAGGRYGVRIAAGLSAVMVTTFTPYLDSRQLAGIVGGLKGAAEYERRLGVQGAGSRGMDAQSTAHLAIIVLVVIGNVAYFAARRKP